MDLTIGQCASLAVLMEVTAPKPGNVHRGADFENLGFFQFAAGAVAIAPALEQLSHAQLSLGAAVLQAVQGTRALAGTNVNLGTVLLIAPLAAVPRTRSLAEGISTVLAELTCEDARDVYRAINEAQAGGLGHVSECDLSGPPPEDLVAAMQLAAEWDLVALQYANGFQEVLGPLRGWLLEALEAGLPLQTAIVRTHVRQLATTPDSLIARKIGPELASHVMGLAQRVLESGPATSTTVEEALSDLDFWFRCDAPRRNPGTTADLLAAALFCLLRDGQLTGPFDYPFWTGGDS